ncbi:hypothetical protein BX666DRAFT_1857292, partial [Dichotomocladium elegans]
QTANLPAEKRLDIMFNQMLDRRGIHDDKVRREMQNWDINKKWLMVNQDRQAEMMTTVSAHQEGHHASVRRSPSTSTRDNSGIAVRRPVNTQPAIISPSNSSNLRSSRSSTTSNNSSSSSPRTSISGMTDIAAGDRNSPEFFIRKLTEPSLRGLTPGIIAHLEVSLRTRPIDWVARFIQLRGLHALVQNLSLVNRQSDRKDKTLEIETDIVKAIKAIANTKIGVREIMTNQEFIHVVVFSLLSPSWITRKLVCDLLVFLCYCQHRRGHGYVLRGFALMQQKQQDLGIFDSWLKTLERTIDGRGKLGSMLSNMILVNSLTTMPLDDVNKRIHLRNQLNAAGMQARVLPKLSALDYHWLNMQIENYTIAAENDLDEAFSDEISIYSDISQPSELLDLLLEGLSDTPRASEYLVTLLRYLLTIKGDPDVRTQYYHMICELVGQVALDQRGGMSSKDFSSVFGVSVDTLIQKFSNQDKIHQLEEESAYHREQYMKIVNEKKELELMLQDMRGNGRRSSGSRVIPGNEDDSRAVNVIKAENASLRELLRTSRSTIAMLQERLREMDAITETEEEPFVPGLVLGNEWKMARKKFITLNPKPSSNIINRMVFTSYLAPPPPPSGSGSPPLPPPPPPPPPPPAAASGSKSPASKTGTNLFALWLLDTVPPVPGVPKRKELNYYPATKLKNFQWQKIHDNRVENTVWALEGVDEKEFEEVLARSGAFEKLDMTFPAKVNTLFERKIKAKLDDRHDAIRFLSKEKSRSLIDDELCTDTFLGNLITYAPSKDDDLITMEKYINATDDERQKLDTPEQFTIEMMKIYRYEARLQFMLFRVIFWERYDQLMKNMTTVVEVSDSLRNSNSLKELLCLVLMLGNYMNGNSLQGGAFGIRVSSLNKLADTKASNTSNITLLHVLVGITRRQFPHIQRFLHDLRNVSHAARIMASVNDMMEQYSDMRQSLKKLDIELDSQWREVELNEGDRFVEVMTKHRNAAAERFEELQTLYINMDAKWKDVMTFYGENPKAMRPDDFFGIFSKFLTHWKVSAIVEEKYTKKKESEEKRKKMEEDRRQRLEALRRQQNNAKDDRRMMDNLLDKLRSGDSENRQRRERRQRRVQEKPAEVPVSIESDPGDMGAISAEDLLKRLQAESVSM